VLDPLVSGIHTEVPPPPVPELVPPATSQLTAANQSSKKYPRAPASTGALVV